MTFLNFRLNEVLEFAEDMEIDIPKIWAYLGELIGPMVEDGSVPMSFLKDACKPLYGGKAGVLVAAILHDASHRLVSKLSFPLYSVSGTKSVHHMQE